MKQKIKLKKKKLINNKKQTIMAKYELMQKTETNGEIWYFIRKDDGLSVENSWTKNLERAEEMLQGLKNGKPSEPIFEILKTIEVDEN